MKVKKGVTIFYPFNFGTIKSYYEKTFIGEEELKKFNVSNGATKFNVFYIIETEETDFLNEKFVSKPFLFTSYVFNSNMPLKEQVDKAFAQMAVIDTYVSDNEICCRGVEEVYPTVHAEIGDEEQVINGTMQLKDVIIPYYSDKIKFYKQKFIVIYVFVAEKKYPVYLYSAPIDPKTIYVGKVTGNFDGKKEVQTRHNNVCYANEEDLVVSPKKINKMGLIKRL